jgi:DNA polymerase III alpha subunit (gram-positive type)
MSKTFLQIFEKYKADEQSAKILELAQNIKIQADKEKRMMQVSVDFSRIVSKEDLYFIEAEIRHAYELNMVKILPHYPEELFDSDYISELMRETETVGIVARGFFSKYRYNLTDGTLTIEIPFSEGGISLLYDARTPAVMEAIIFSEFGIRIKVNIVHTSDEIFLASNNSLDQAIKDFDVKMTEAAKNARVSQSSSSADAPSEAEMLPRKTTLFEDEASMEITDGICSIGKAKFDVSSPEYVFGDAFVISPVSISTITSPQRNLVIIGTVFGFVAEPNRAGDRVNVSFSVTDTVSSIEVKHFVAVDEADAITSCIKNGSVIALKGYAKKETRKDKTEGT